MEVYEDKVIVLAKDGSFLEVNRDNRDLDIGQEIEVDDNNKRIRGRIIRRLASIAAAFILLITTGYGVYGYYTPYGYINVDINPSVEIAYNLYNRVIDLKGLNEDGNILISKIKNYRNRTIENVINEVIDTAVEQAYVRPEQENVILITITEKKDKVDDEKIYKLVDNHIKQKIENTEVILIEGDNNIYKRAREDKISPGKLMLIEKAIDLNKDIKFEEVAKKPVKEIMRMIKEAKREKEKKEERKKLEKKTEKEMDKIEEMKFNKSRKAKEKKEDKLEREEIEKFRKDETKKDEEEKEIEVDKIEKDKEKDQRRYPKKKSQDEFEEQRKEKQENLIINDNKKNQDNKYKVDKSEKKNKSKRGHENEYKHNKKERGKDED